MSYYYYYCKYCDDYKKKEHKCSKNHDKYCDEKKQINVKVDCCCGNKTDLSVRASGFKAISNVDQRINANAIVDVLFQMEQFDYDNEYNPATSTFTAKTAGLYIFNPSIVFVPDNQVIPFSIVLALFVNNELITRGADTEYYESSPPFVGFVVKDTVIVQLNAGDQVEIRIFSPQPGVLEAGVNTSFSAGRFPSPA
ncbi:ABC transporter permease [Bacillus wiedmannii]|uniref:C1q-like domain-containing protein n=1 Tax=Bacillus wiedmannii TaxID=1890302 RepID=UPI0024ACF713|nr:ABC transporter permease [Bacillus wiedmannii]MDI6679742.1 ABC transporter permease [Bacillus wiedmannii]